VTERELARRAAHRLAITRHAQEVTGNVALTCQYFGITRQAFYKWLRRYEEQGVEGLRERSRRPHVIPHATKPEVVSKIVYLRQHYQFGPHKIAMYLKRYHDIEVSPSGVRRILKRLNMSRLPASQRYRRHVDRWKRYEKLGPRTSGMCRQSFASSTNLGSKSASRAKLLAPAASATGRRTLVPIRLVRTPRRQPLWASFIITTREREKPISTSSSGLRHRIEAAWVMTASVIGF
jgi:transposase